MLQLQAVNILLNAIGEFVIEEVETDHPLHAQALFVLDQVSRTEQNKDLWFNSYEVTIQPDVDGKIPVPADALKVITKWYKDQGVIKKGAFLWDLNKRTDVLSRPVKVGITEFWAFEDLPDSFAMYVTALAAAQFAASHDAEQAKLQFLAAQIEVAKIPHAKEQIQQIKVNLDHTPSAYGKGRDAWANRYRS